MLSWKQKKLRDEKRKAKRAEKHYSVSHAGKKHMGRILDGRDSYSEDGKFIESVKRRIRISIFRDIFRRKT